MGASTVGILKIKYAVTSLKNRPMLTALKDCNMQNKRDLRLFTAEELSLWLSFVTASVAFLFIFRNNVSLDLLSFMPAAIGFVTLFGGALIYRRLGRSQRISNTLSACGIFIIFSASGVILNYALLSGQANIIDTNLFAIDHWIGFNWQIFAEQAARFPVFSRWLGPLYNSSIIQITFVILLLGFIGRPKQLHHFLLVGIIASIASILTWAFFPSFGPSAYINLAPEIDANLGRVFNVQLGQKLLELYANGPTIISANNLLGLIAFPSMHTVMALMCVWHVRATWFFWPMLLTNLLMIPAILLHGGHHLIDIIGGLVLFIISCRIASRLIPDSDYRPNVP